MMMIAPNFLVRQKEGAEGEEEEEEASGGRKRGPIGTPTPVAVFMKFYTCATLRTA